MNLDLGKVPWWRLSMLTVLAVAAVVVVRVVVAAVSADWPNDHTMPTSAVVVLLGCAAVFLGGIAQYLIAIRDVRYQAFVVEDGQRRFLGPSEYLPARLDQPGIAADQDDFGLKTIAYLDAVSRGEADGADAVVFIDTLAALHDTKPHPRRAVAVSLAVLSALVAVLASAAMTFFTWRGDKLASAASFASRTAVVVAFAATAISQVRASTAFGRQMRGQLMDATKAVVDGDMHALRVATERMRAIHPVPKSIVVNTRTVVTVLSLGLIAYMLVRTLKPQKVFDTVRAGRTVRTRTRAYVDGGAPRKTPAVVGGAEIAVGTDPVDTRDVGTGTDTLMHDRFNARAALAEPRISRVALIAELNSMRPAADAVAVGHVTIIVISLLVVILTVGQVGSIA